MLPYPSLNHCIQPSFFFHIQPKAERAAWDYMMGLSPEEKFELTVMHPGFVIGPVISGGITTSMEVCALTLLNFAVNDRKNNLNSF